MLRYTRSETLIWRARVNENLPLEFDDVALTSYAGLELFARYLRHVHFNRLVRHAFAGGAAWGDFGVVAMVRIVIGLLVVGGRRLRHLGYVAVLRPHLNQLRFRYRYAASPRDLGLSDDVRHLAVQFATIRLLRRLTS